MALTNGDIATRDWYRRDSGLLILNKDAVVLNIVTSAFWFSVGDFIACISLLRSLVPLYMMALERKRNSDVLLLS